MLSETTKPADNGGSTEQTRSGAYYRPTVDILERTADLVLFVDLPGVAKAGLDIDFQDSTLTINGRVPSRQPEDTIFVAREYGVGDFQRAFQVGEQIDPARITAEYAEGVLTLRLPKLEAAKPRKIAVNAKQDINLGG